jgi:ribosome biogenesis GTPase A
MESGLKECSSSVMTPDDRMPAETPESIDGASRLLRLAELAQEPGAEPVVEEARELAARIAEGRFYVACVGQFKRGKSTLLNALVGHEVVPTGYVPVTPE